jgi:purine catabolism regulator
MPGRLPNAVSSTVGELRASSLLADARLLAGGGGLGRPVHRVQWVEVLDDKADHFAPGDLLLTTAYNLRDDRALQRGLAAQMLDFGVSAVVIKCGYYLDRVPPLLLEAADRLDLPILELDRSVAFVEVAQTIYDQLTARSTARLRRSAAVHRELVRLVTDGGGLDALLGRAAELLDTPLWLTGESGGPLAAAAAERRPPVGAAAFPVTVRDRRAATLWAPADAAADELVEQVAGVAALVVAADERRPLELERRCREFVLELVTRGGDPADLAARSDELGITVPMPAEVVAVHAGSMSPPVLRRALYQQLATGSLSACAAEWVVAVVPAGSIAPSALQGLAGEPAGGVSGPAVRLEELPGHHVRARRAAQLGRALYGPGLICDHARIEVYDALLGDGDGERLASVRARVLGPLPDELRRTLAALTAAGGSVAAAATQLYVHRNTVRYRLGRIERLTGLDLARSEDRLLCELALLLDRIQPDPPASDGVAAGSGRHRR